MAPSIVIHGTANNLDESNKNAILVIGEKLTVRYKNNYQYTEVKTYDIESYHAFIDYFEKKAYAISYIYKTKQ